MALNEHIIGDHDTSKTAIRTMTMTTRRTVADSPSQQLLNAIRQSAHGAVPPASLVYNSPSVYPCLVRGCTAEFASSRDLRVHQERKHYTKNTDARLECPNCDIK